MADVTGSAPPILEAEIDVRPYLHLLARIWRVCALGAVAGAAAAFLSASRQPTLYEAVTTMSIERPVVQAADALRGLLQGSSIVSDVVSELALDAGAEPVTLQQFRDRALRVEDVPGTKRLEIRVRLADPVKAAAASRLIASRSLLRVGQSRQPGTGTVGEIVIPAVTPSEPVPRQSLRASALGTMVGAVVAGIAAMLTRAAPVSG